ncbi:MAG: hypothetical protein NUV77_09885 [Thermoguttaceae bacterium]|jgi:cell division protein FtsB|nr:hypothetical protein [Thermoguttaceae bacterium]
MARRSTRWPASLDLILDTVCNTFGCILLLALLVSILARHAGQRVQASVESLQLQARWQREWDRYRAMQAEWQALREQLADLPADAEALGRQEQALRDQCRELVEEIARLENARQNLQQQQAKAKQKAEDLRRTLDQARDELAQAAKSLAQKQEELVLSMEREAPGKRPIALVVRFGRLYVWHRYDAMGLRAGLNTDDFLVVGREPGGILTQPKPYAGVPLDGPDNEARVAQRLRVFHPQTDALHVAVWPDSFAEFAVLRRVAVRMGFEYRLLAMAEGEPLFDRGGHDSRVQ